MLIFKNESVDSFSAIGAYFFPKFLIILFHLSPSHDWGADGQNFYPCTLDREQKGLRVSSGNGQRVFLDNFRMPTFMVILTMGDSAFLFLLYILRSVAQLSVI